MAFPGLRTGAIIVAVVLSAVIGTAIGRMSAPGQLNLLDRVTGWRAQASQIGAGIAYGRDDRQRLDIWAPMNSTASSHPVLVFFYGGGWVEGDRADYGFAARAYAEKGFVVVLPDYRLAPDARFPDFLYDGAAAVRWTRDNIARFGGNPDKIVLAGHSAGAYNAMMLALDPRYLKHEGLSPAAIRGVAGLSGPYDFYPFRGEPALVVMGGYPNPAETQPVHFARAGAPPIWLGTGTNDIVVNPRNTLNLAGALKAQGGSVELRQYQGLGHREMVMALSAPFRNKATVLDDSTAFLKQAVSR